MKKTILAILAISMILLVITPAFAGNNKPAKGKSVLIELKLASDIQGKKIVMQPKVLTLDKNKATITIGGGKTTLNDKKVDSDKKMDEASKTFLTKIEVIPEIIPGTDPVNIKLKVKFFMDQKGATLNREFTFTVVDGNSFSFASKDKEQKEEISLKIKASIYRGQFDKKKK